MFWFGIIIGVIIGATFSRFWRSLWKRTTAFLSKWADDPYDN